MRPPRPARHRPARHLCASDTAVCLTAVLIGLAQEAPPGRGPCSACSVLMPSKRVCSNFLLNPGNVPWRWKEGMVVWGRLMGEAVLELGFREMHARGVGDRLQPCGQGWRSV